VLKEFAGLEFRPSHTRLLGEDRRVGLEPKSLHARGELHRSESTRLILSN
jgi:hypothetical protein